MDIGEYFSDPDSNAQEFTCVNPAAAHIIRQKKRLKVFRDNSRLIPVQTHFAYFQHALYAKAD